MQREPEPWTTVATTPVYACDPWIRVESHRVRLPDGREIEPYFRVVFRPWCTVAAFDERGDLVVIRQYHHGIGAVQFGLPGGIMDPGEDPAACARRELLEETGYEAAEWHALGSYIPNSNYRCGEGHAFVGYGARKVREAASGDLEELQTLTLPQSRARAAVLCGEMQSMTSALTVMLALDHARS